MNYSSLIAQELPQPHILVEADVAQPDSATLDDIAWLEGHWQGPAFDGTGEELWSPPHSGSMMGMYRYIDKNDNIAFYEFLIIKEVAGSLILKLKHFNDDLTGWEEKDKTIDFPLLKKTEKTLYFSGFTFHKINDQEMVIYLRIKGKDGKEWEERFPYKRI